MNGYELSRSFWNFAFENPEKIKPTHISIYFFAIEHCNRLGWKEKFGLPTSMVLEGIGIKSYSVYKKAFDDLVSFGFITVVEYSKNQYSSNIIALKEYYKADDKASSKAHSKALDKALDKALIKHTSKHLQSTYQSTDSIDKQETRNKEQGTREQGEPARGVMLLSLKDFEKEIRNSGQKLEAAARRNRTTVDKIVSMIPDFIDTCTQKEKTSDTWPEYCTYFANWLLIECSKATKAAANGTSTIKAKSFVISDEEERANKEYRDKHYKPSNSRASELKGIGDKIKEQLNKISPTP